MESATLRCRLLDLYKPKTPTADLLDFLDVLMEEVILLREKVAMLEFDKRWAKCDE